QLPAPSDLPPLSLHDALPISVRRAFARPLNRRGTIRPQQGLEYLFAKSISTGLLPPPRDLEALHDNLIRRGIARAFGGSNCRARSEEHTSELQSLTNILCPLL